MLRQFYSAYLFPLLLQVQVATKYIAAILVAHKRAIYCDRDSIRDVVASIETQRNPTEQPYNRHYLVPILLFTYYYIDNFIILKWSDPVDRIYANLITHKMFFRELWPLANVINDLAGLMVIGVYAKLSCNDQLQGKFQMYATHLRNGVIKLYMNYKELDPAESTRILQYRGKVKLLIHLVKCSIQTHILCIHLWQFLCANWSNSYRDYFLLFFIPLFFIYLPNSVFFMIYYFILTARYLRTKQHCRIVCLKQLRTAVDFAPKRRRKKKKPKYKQQQDESHYHLIWHQFGTVNRAVIGLFEEIAAHNHYWTAFLTIWFVGYVGEIAYMQYTFFFFITSINSRAQKNFFIFISLNLFTMLMLITGECTLIVDNNKTIHREIRHFYWAYQERCSLQTRDRLKFDNFEAIKKSFSRIGFALYGCRVNARMFELLFFYLSTVYMRIIDTHINRKILFPHGAT